MVTLLMIKIIPNLLLVWSCVPSVGENKKGVADNLV